MTTPRKRLEAPSNPDLRALPSWVHEDPPDHLAKDWWFGFGTCGFLVAGASFILVGYVEFGIVLLVCAGYFIRREIKE